MAGRGTKKHPGLVHKKTLKVDAVRNEINVTPLVDVCLVLLIIFMVITPLLARGKEVKLPKTRHHSVESDKNQPIVAIDQKGRVYFDKDQVSQLVPARDEAILPDEGPVQYMLDKPEDLQRRVEDAWNRMEEEGVVDGDGNPVGRKIFVKAHPDLEYGKVYPVVMTLHELGLANIDLGTHELKEEAGE